MPYDLDFGVPSTNFLSPPASAHYGDSFRENINAPLFDIFNTPQFQQIQKLFAPQGGNGLSDSLSKMLELGGGQLDQRRNQAVASARTRAQGVGLEGSSIEQAGIGAAEAADQQGFVSLLQSILGMQQQQTGQLGQYLFSGLGMQESEYNQRLMALLQYLQGGELGAANLGLYREGMDQANSLASKQNSAGTLNALIGLGGSLGSAWIKKGILG